MNGNQPYYPNGAPGQYPPQQPQYQQPQYQQPQYPPQQYPPQMPQYQQPQYQPPQYQPPQYPPQQPTYQQVNIYNGGVQPGYRVPLKTNKSLVKLILLSIITFGIYGLVCMTSVGTSINTAASPYDHKKTMHFCLLAFLIAPITLGIGAIVWYHKISDRIGDELIRRRINYSFGSTDFWLWGILGSLLFGVGPLVYTHKLLKSTNYICENYNMYG